MKKVHIRWMIRRDMSEVCDIDFLSFENSWNEKEFLKCLRQRNCIGMVAEHEEVLVGFMLYELEKTNLHIINFAVHPDHRYQLIGTQMIFKLINKLNFQRRTTITIEVRDQNLPMQLFLKKLGFICKKVSRGFYKECDDDCYHFEYSICDAAFAEGVTLD